MSNMESGQEYAMMDYYNNQTLQNNDEEYEYNPTLPKVKVEIKYEDELEDEDELNESYHYQSFSEEDEIEHKYSEELENSIEPAEIKEEAVDDAQEDFNEEIYRNTEGYDEEANQTETGKLACEKCGKVYGNKSSLASHRSECGKERSFSCELCEKKFPYATRLKRHMKVHETKLFHCEMCNENFSRQCALTLHNGRYHPDIKIYKCKYCGLMLRTKDDQEVHQRTHLNKPKHKYSEELENSIQPAEVKEEVADYLQENVKEEVYQSIEYVTEDTEYITPDTEYVTEDIEYATEDTEYVTEDAEYVTEDTEYVTEDTEYAPEVTENATDEYFGGYAEEANQNETKKLACEKCGKVYGNKSSLASHRSECGKERLHSCELCEKKFPFATRLKRHMKVHETELTCEKCGKILFSKSSLSSHRSTCGKERSFSCEICEKKFPKASRLKIHMTVHETKHFHCEICDENFSRQSALTLHNGNHHPDIKIYKCKFCDEMFRTKDDQEIHQRTHTDNPKQLDDGISGDKWKCEICGTGFAQKRVMETHIKNLHADQKAYKCKECGKQYHKLHSLQV